jgi:hypothetical protein
MKEEISKDIHRTYYISLIEGDSSEMLARVLYSIGCLFPKVGYCQGMNFIAGALLAQFQDEGLAFWAFVSMIEALQLENLFIAGIPDMHLRSF